jgi:hypothetical protein
VTGRWMCERHGYVECSRCEPPRSAHSAPATTTNEKSRAEEIGRAVLTRLARHREKLRARGAALESEIEALISSDFGPKRGRAARVWQRLNWTPKPSLRTVYWHLQRRKHCATP